MIRTKTLTRYNVKAYKYFWVFFYGSIFLIIFYASFSNLTLNQVEFKTLLSGLLGPFLLGSVFYKMLRVILKVEAAEFDENSLFISKAQFEIQIPLEEIRSITLVAATGIFKVQLYSRNQVGDVFYIKPSLFYPVNYKLVDNKIDHLNTLIERKKESVRSGEALPTETYYIDERMELK